MVDTSALGNSSSTLNTTTTLAPEVTTSFDDVPGIVYNFQEMSTVDWDDVYDGNPTSPRAYTSWNALNIIRLTLATWTIASHVALIFFVLSKRVLRVQPKNLLIVNMAMANLLMGGFVVPVKLHFTLNPDHSNCNLAVGWTFISEYYQTSVALFAVFGLVFERFVYVYTEKKQKIVRPLYKVIGTAILLVIPWILSMLILLPTFFGGLLAKNNAPESCLFKTDDSYFVASQLLAFIPACFGVFLLAPFTGLFDCLRPRSCFYKPLTPKGESTTVTAIVSLVSMFCEVPYCIVRVLMMRMDCNTPYCAKFAEGLTMTMWLRICKAAIFPFIWLAYTDIRNAMRCHSCKWDWELAADDDDNKDEGECEEDARI